jgi:hypothetical protein
MVHRQPITIHHYCTTRVFYNKQVLDRLPTTIWHYLLLLPQQPQAPSFLQSIELIKQIYTYLQNPVVSQQLQMTDLIPQELYYKYNQGKYFVQN